MTQFKQTNTGERVVYKPLSENGFELDLNGATAEFYMMKNGQTYVNAPAYVENQSLVYDFTEQDTLYPGVYAGEFKVVYQDGTVKHYPEKGFLSIKIDKILNPDASTVGEERVALQVSLVEDFKAEVNAKLVGVEDATLAANDAATHATTQGDYAKAEADRLVGTDVSVLDNRVTQLDAQLADIAVNAKQFGLDENATWEINRDAIQQANDYVYSQGGGVVLIPPGTYTVKGVMLDSGVKLQMYGVTLRSPDGFVPAVISSREYQTTGTVSVDSEKLTVANTKNIQKGTLVAILGAGGISETQKTTLATDTSATDLTLQLTGDDGKFPQYAYLLVGSEVIKYSNISNGVVNVTERGAFGTTPVSHSSGEPIGIAKVMYSEVLEINGNVLTLRDKPVVSVSNADVLFGTVNVGIEGGIIDGNKSQGYIGPSVVNVIFRLARWSSIKNIIIKNGEQGGLMLERNSCENHVDNVVFSDIGVYDSAEGLNKGSMLWLYQGCKRNKLTNLTLRGKGWTGIYFDNRTTVASHFDAANEYNYLTNFTIDFDNTPVGYNPAITVVGSNYNIISNGYIRGPYVGFKLELTYQHFGEDLPSENNEVHSIHLDVRQPWSIDSPNNRIHNITYSDRMIATPKTDPLTVSYMISEAKGKPAKFGRVFAPNGVPSAPSYTFESDPDTGFYRFAENIVALSLGGGLTQTFYPTQVRYKDGYKIETGTDLGLFIGLNPQNKIGFFGKAPVAQQPAMAGTSGRTLSELEVEVNALKTVLRSFGLIAQ